VFSYGFFSPFRAVVSVVITLIVLAFAYFAIIKPTTKTVDRALTNSGVLHSPVAGGGNHTAGATKNLNRLVTCVTRAHGNATKIHRCEAKFKP
jgi:hypothetical protein